MRLTYEQFLAEADRAPAMPSTEHSKIVEFFNGKTVLVTGATGFLGKLVIEKILRTCPEIDRIHVMVRAKKNEDCHTRLDNLCNESLFGPLKKLMPKFQQKINVVKGDMSLPDLGLDPEDRQLIIEKVNVIFHIAATVKFNEVLTTAAAINVRGTRDLLNIAEKCKFLHSFVYVSTAYSNCYNKVIKETFYPTPANAEQLIDVMDDREALHAIRKDLFGKWPNNYVFSKAVSENLVKEYEGKFEICIVRPGAVTATYNEPLKSWNDNINGISGALLGCHTGILKSVPCNGEKRVEIVPADYVTNCMIAAAYKTAVKKRKAISIYNYISSAENRMTYSQLRTMYAIYADDVPSMNSCWYDCMLLNRYKAIHYLCVLILQFLPALILDAFLVVTGKKPIMVTMSRKTAKFASSLGYFATREWKFENGNTQNLWKSLGEPDQNLFPFSMAKIDWDDYHRTHAMGLRTYVLKEDAKNLAQARKRWKRLYVIHVVVKMAFKCLVIYMAHCVLTKIYY